MVDSKDTMLLRLRNLDALIRAQRSHAQRSVLMTQRYDLFMTLYPERAVSGHVRRKNPAEPNFQDDSATQLEMGRSTAAQYLKRGRQIDPAALRLIANTVLDTTSYLDAMFSTPPERQQERVLHDLQMANHVANLKAARRKTVKRKGARPTLPVADQEFDMMMTVWRRMGEPARDMFREEILGFRPYVNRRAS